MKRYELSSYKGQKEPGSRVTTVGLRNGREQYICRTGHYQAVDYESLYNHHRRIQSQDYKTKSTFGIQSNTGNPDIQKWNLVGVK